MDYKKVKIPPFNLSDIIDGEEESTQSIQKDEYKHEKTSENDKSNEKRSPLLDFIFLCLLFSILFSPLLLLKGTSNILFFVAVLLAASLMAGSST